MTSPEPPRNVPKSGEPVYQMLWDCQFCGTQKLLGVDHRFCPNCGARQDPEWRYFPSEADKKLVTDPKYVYHGADRACPYCKQPNSAAAQFCVACGGDLSGAAEVERRRSVIAGSAEDTGKARDLVLERFQAQQAAAKPAKPKSNPLPLLLILAAIVGVVGVLIFLAVQRTPAELVVDDLQWSRVIAVERLNTLTGSGWHDQVPPGAYDVSCSLRDRPYTVTERVQTGVRRVDRGDGTFIEQPVYENRSRTEYRPERYCNYSYDQWQRVREVRTSGGADDPLVWGALNLGVREREGGREERLMVFFKRVDKPQERRLEYRAKTEIEWRSFKINQRYTVNFDGFGNVIWSDLKVQEPR
ncbi:MAG: zinc ribbon domain-containing protein [Anaerolineae bacterium]|nr:zinc ribbon domain-containing protein [Anaerolineae bacterium]